MRTLRETLLDHLDERDELVGRIVDSGLELMRPAIVAAVTAATPKGAPTLDAALSAFHGHTGLLQLAAHGHVREMLARHKTERAAAADRERGGPILKPHREARRASRG